MTINKHFYFFVGLKALYECFRKVSGKVQSSFLGSCKRLISFTQVPNLAHAQFDVWEKAGACAVATARMRERSTKVAKGVLT